MNMFGKKNALEEYIEADPTTYSKLTLSYIERTHIIRGKIYDIIQDEERIMELEESISNKVFLEEQSNFEYVEIIQNEKEQKLISMILKGIIPVSDIIKIDNMYISSVMNTSKIQMNNTLYDFNSDTYLLDLLFFDGDHGIDINMNHCDDYSKYYFFDFGVNCFSKENSINIGMKMDYNINSLLKLLISCGENDDILFSKSHLQKSIILLKDRFMGDVDGGYSFFMSLVDQSGINEDIGKKYWRIFINNIRNIEYGVDLLEEAGFGI